MIVLGTFGTLTTVTVTPPHRREDPEPEANCGVTETVKAARIAAAALYQDHVTFHMVYSGRSPVLTQARDIVLENTRRLPRDMAEAEALDQVYSSTLSRLDALQIFLEEQLVPALARGDDVLMVATPYAIRRVLEMLPWAGSLDFAALLSPASYTFDRRFRVRSRQPHVSEG